MHQSTTPSLSQTIWLRWASRQFLGLLIVQTLLPVTFGYSLSSEAVVMRQLRRWKWLWHTHTRGLPWGLPDVVRTVQQVHCSQWRLLRRGLKFFECPSEKSLETYLMILVSRDFCPYSDNSTECQNLWWFGSITPKAVLIFPHDSLDSS